MIANRASCKGELMMSSVVFNQEATDHLKARLFLDPGGNPEIQRYERVRYDTLENFVDKQLSFFWRPEEVDLSKDKNDFRDLPEAQQHIFTSNLFRQILLDSVQGRGPNLTFLPICSLPELEDWITNWSFNETLHSRAYTHVIRNVYSNPSDVIDKITTIPEILQCADAISKYYDDLARWNAIWQARRLGINVTDSYDEYEHKKAVWLALNSVNALEGLRFYVSFACSWNFAEQKKMEGNAKIIRLICRDENLHLGSTQYILRTLPKDDTDYKNIATETKDEVMQLFLDVIQQEKEWATYLFKYGSMIGLNEEILHQYVDWIASRRMKTIDLDVPFAYPTSDPLPWTKNWISGKEVQYAPQEAEIASYLISDVEQDVDASTLNGLSL
jgi:ribonucleoside-diphosphate reductase beta chain